MLITHAGPMERANCKGERYFLCLRCMPKQFGVELPNFCSKARVGIFLAVNGPLITHRDGARGGRQVPAAG